MKNLALNVNQYRVDELYFFTVNDLPICILFFIILGPP